MTIGPQYGGVGGMLAHQLRRASQAVNAAWQLRSSDLTPPQFAVLQVLDECGSLDQKTLGALAAVDRSTLTPLLDRLLARDLITKTTDPSNRRRQLVALTPAGHERAVLGCQQVGESSRWIEEQLGHERLETLTLLLKELADASRDQ
ncbi:MarR family winged helix-turn-helix transcriptional regulator [Streptomyces sp. NPDC051956]|uniref:MarR family winged helix-turn-helix transcriptional regulator n=1 Tax=Streptomyces sp. NPDC051956 TaxID=3365677 RepID=UPI0037D818A2